MDKSLLHYFLVLVFSCMPFFMLAQNTDCRTAIVICSDSSFSFLPSGPGIDDFENPNNDQGCLFTRETISAWFYFELREDMPPASELTFLIKDTLREFQIDYDFAVYGANINCDSLGSPLRCSYARLPNDVRPGFTINTGLSEGEVDTTETFINANGLLKPMTVNPREGFFLVVDMFVSTDPNQDFASFDSTTAQSFSFEWGGPAAPFLNCIANPNCDQVIVDVGEDIRVCAGDTVQLRTSAQNTAGQESYRWEGTDGATAYIDDPDAAETFAVIPFDVSGDLTFTSTVSEGACVHADELLVTVDPAGEADVTGDTLVCEEETTILSAQEGFSTYTWSDGSQQREFTAAGPGVYRVTVTSGAGCPGITEVTVFSYPVPEPAITGPTGFCPGGETQLRADDGFVSYDWSTGSTDQSVIVNQPGPVTLTATDTFGCIVNRTVDVIELSPPVPEVNGPRAICSGDETTLVAEEGYLSYEWSTNETVPTVTYNSAGTYTLTVIDNNGCQGSRDITITERDDPAVAIDGDNFFCSNEQGRLEATPGYIQYNWSTGDSLPVIWTEEVARISVTVTDQFGCRGSASTNTDTFPTPQIRFDNPDYFCTGESLTLRISEVYDSMTWSTGDTMAFTTISEPGVYQVAVKDINNCQNTGSFAVTEAPNPEPVIQGDEALCPGETSTLSLVNTYQAYSWSTGETTPTIRTTQSGTVSVEVTDNLGCLGTDEFTIIPLSAPVVRISGLDAICEGDEARLIANAGFQQYRWSTGAQTQAITVDQPGNYGVTVTDENSCQAFESVNFDVNPNPKPRIGGSLNFCEGGSTQLQVQGGSFTEYNWSTGDMGANLQVSAEAEYAVTVTTAAGCENADTVFVEAFRPIPSPISGGEIALCEGERATLDAGPGFLEYVWSTGENTQVIEVDQEGVYELTVLDTNICLSETQVRVREYPIRQPSIIGQSAFCSGQRSTLIAGGTFRAYNWSTGQEGKNIQIDSGGLYSVTVTDNNGCESSASRFIAEEESPEIDLTGPQVLCGIDTITLSVTGGYSSYLWTNNAQDTSIVVTEAGRYGVLVFGNNGCASSAEMVVQQRTNPLVRIEGPRNICSNDSTQLASNDSYIAYQWSTGDTTPNISIRQAGVYELSVVDRFGCPGFARAQVQVRQAPEFAINGPRRLCTGDSITLAIDSDSLYRDYLWNTGNATSSLVVTEPGLYSVSVTATNDCLTEDSVQINTLESPQPRIVGDTFFCSGRFTLLEADTTYARYSWSGGRMSSSIRVTEPGTYRLEVGSAEGCEGSDEIIVAEIPLPVADAGPDTLLNCYQPRITLGNARDTVGSFYLPIWSGPGITADNRNDFRPSIKAGGTYTFIVQDTLYGCTEASDIVQVDDLQFIPQLNLASPDTINCRVPETQLQATEVSQGPRTGYRWTALDRSEILGNELIQVIRQGGRYQFEVLDTLTGCRRADTLVVLAELDPPAPKQSPIGSISCRRDSQILIVPAAPLGELWAYAWENETGSFGTPGIDSLRRTVFLPGTYRVLIENTANGCQTIDSLIVRDNLAGPAITAGPDDELDCLTEEVRLGGPVADPDWQLSWSRVDDIGFASDVPRPVIRSAGIYVLDALDPRTGCTASDTVEITAYTNFPQAINPVIRDVRCFGEVNGQIAIPGVQGGERPLLYSINDRPFSTNTTFDNLPAGRYEIVVQDARGCELSEVVLVGPGNDVFVDLGPDQFVKQGERVRVRALTSIPDGEQGELRWTRPDTLSCDTCVIQTFRPLETTQLRAFAVDTNGCRGEDVVTIFVDTRKQIYVPSAFSPDNGDGVNDVVMIYSARNVDKVIAWQIYDRWGELVFQQEDFQPNDPAFGWNGTWRNVLQSKRKQEDRFTMMNAQVFVYYAKVQFIDGEIKEFTGDITLVK